jgi:hypothetical protein
MPVSDLWSLWLPRRGNVRRDDSEHIVSPVVLDNFRNSKSEPGISQHIVSPIAFANNSNSNSEPAEVNLELRNALNRIRTEAARSAELQRRQAVKLNKQINLEDPPVSSAQILQRSFFTSNWRTTFDEDEQDAQMGNRERCVWSLLTFSCKKILNIIFDVDFYPL